MKAPVQTRDRNIQMQIKQSRRNAISECGDISLCPEPKQELRKKSISRFQILAPRFGGHGAPQRSKAFSAGCLQQAHQSHVAEAKKEKQQKRNGAPHMQSCGIDDSEHKVNSEPKLE